MTQPSSTAPSVKKQFTACYSAFMINGALALSVGALLPYLRGSYGLGYAFAGLLVSLHSVGNLISSFFAGALGIWLGQRRSILLFTLFFPISFLCMLSASPLALAAAFFCTGLARGAGTNYTTEVVNALAPGRAWAMNALHASFAVGAFLAPLGILGFTAESAERWRLMCWLMAALGVVSLLLYGQMPARTASAKTGTEKAAAKSGFLREKQFWVSTGTLFFYLCAEQGVIGWLVTYFQDSGRMSAAYAQSMASVLWVLILAGRLVAAWLSTRLPRAALLCGMGLGSVLFFLVVLAGQTLPVITFGIAGFGFFMAGIFPTTVACSGSLLEAYPMAWSVMLTTAGFGSILMPSVIGAVAQRAGIFAGISTIVIAVVLTLVCIAANFFLNRKQAAVSDASK